MKVLHVCKVFLPDKGGVQVVIARICQGLKEKVNSSILTTYKGKSLPESSVAKVIRSYSFFNFKSLPISPSLIFKLFTSINKYEVVCVHYPFPLADFVIALLPRKKYKLIIYWHAEIVPFKFLKKLVQPFTKRMLMKADKIIIASPAILDHSLILSDFSEKCEVIPFGYQRKSPSKKLNIDVEFLAIGRHVYYKGFEVLIRALVTIDAHVTIIGHGPMLKEHRLLAKNLGIDHKIRFIDDASDDDIVAFIKSSKAIIIPSVLPSEAFSLVQIEAMCYSKPIINTNLASGVPWVARHNIEALTVEPENIEELRDAILTMKHDKHTFLSLSKNAYARYEDIFTLDQFIDRTQKCYEDLLA